MSEGTFRRPPSQEVKEKQEEKREEVKTGENKEADRERKKRLAEYFHPVHGWKGINRSPSYWDRIKEQRRKKRKITKISRKRNRKDKGNDKRRKVKKMRRM